MKYLPLLLVVFCLGSTSKKHIEINSCYRAFDLRKGTTKPNGELLLPKSTLMKFDTVWTSYNLCVEQQDSLFYCEARIIVVPIEGEMTMISLPGVPWSEVRTVFSKLTTDDIVIFEAVRIRKQGDWNYLSPSIFKIQ